MTRDQHVQHRIGLALVAMGVLAAAVVVGQPAVERGDQAVQGHGGVPGGRGGVVVAQQASHGGDRGLTATATRGDAIGHSGDGAPGFLLRRGRQAHASVVFQLAAGAALHAQADV